VLLGSWCAYLLKIDYKDYKRGLCNEMSGISDKFNDLLSLDKSGDNMLFPIYVKKLVWGTLEDGSSSVNASQAVLLYKAKRFPELIELLDQVAKSAPKWLLYTDNQLKFRKELIRMVEIVAQQRNTEIAPYMDATA
jgi:hypothetical protein